MEERIEQKILQRLDENSTQMKEVQENAKSAAKNAKKAAEKKVVVSSPKKNSEKSNEEEKEKNNRGWETVPPKNQNKNRQQDRSRSRSRVRGRSRTRKIKKKITITPTEEQMDNEEDQPIDSTYALRKDQAAVLTVKQQKTDAQTVANWFSTSTIRGYVPDDTTVTQMYSTRGGFQRFKVLLKKFPIQDQTFNEIWRSFMIPNYIEITQWTGDASADPKSFDQKIGWYIGNLNPKKDFSEKLKQRAKEAYPDDCYTATAAKLPPPKNLKEGEVQRTASYCVVIHRKHIADMNDLEEGQYPEFNDQPLKDDLTDHLREVCPGIKIFPWKGRYYTGNRQAQKPVENL